MNTEESDFEKDRKLDRAAYECAWSFVWLVENKRATDRLSIQYVAEFLEAYAETYDSEKCRERARALREQTSSTTRP